MIATAPSSPQTSTLKTSVGFAAYPDLRRAAFEAADIARAGLGGSQCRLALLITAGLTGSDPIPGLKSLLGPAGIAGGATTALMTDRGIVREGALVIALATEGDAASGAVAVPGRDAADAGGRAARIVLAGWPFRLRYPRGLGFVFARGNSPLAFLDTWREFMGPKMRTVCGIMPGAPYGSGSDTPTASVACLEASYATGLGYAEGFVGEEHPDARLIHGAAEATNTALKRLDERSARLVVVFESVARAATLGPAAAEEWHRIVAEAGDVPCVGWLCDAVAGYGRGIQPADDPRALIVAAVGDSPLTPPTAA
ncbi:MAG: hypothetical protein HYR51_04315 [Candidatus Rokubacteria bacterium]|nr:hypothetical protein [Candidatus Rokubacteria bacterium]